MRIVIDLQGAQSPKSRTRGVGRYTMSLTKAIVQNCNEHDIFIALNGLFPETIEPIRADFYGLLPQENIRVWYAPEPVDFSATGNNTRRKTAELVREGFLTSLKPDVVLISSIFEGLGDDSVTSIGEFTNNIPTATILYDLIPFIYQKPYLEDPITNAWYISKLEYLKRSDLLLSISESSRQECIHYLTFPEDAVTNISTAADPHFKPRIIDRKYKIEFYELYNLTRPYVMYTGGVDHRKNIEGLIRAYASLEKAVRELHQLVIVCTIQKIDRSRLESLAKRHGLSNEDLILTGFVPDDDLLTLYNLSKVFVFASWHEGFGLPALEAMSCGCAVIGSNASSIPEVIGKDDALFVPKNDEAIKAKLAQVLTDDIFRAELEQHGLEQAKKFSWDKCAIRAISALEKLHAKSYQKITINTVLTEKPKMAYVSPLPPERSGISDYSAELIPELSRYYDIDIIIDQDSVLTPWINENCKIRNVEWFRGHVEHYDRVLYHFGNSHFHQHMFSLLEEVPGIVVLHDFFLSSILNYMDDRGCSSKPMVLELYISHGYKAVQEYLHAIDPSEVIWEYPCNLSILIDAQGVIVHSEYARNLENFWYNADKTNISEVIPLLRTPATAHSQRKAKHVLNLKENDFVVCSFGQLGPTKLNHRLLDAWLASDLSKSKNCILLFVGESDGGEYKNKLLANIQNSRLVRQIRITGWVDAETFHCYLAAADLAVQLRTYSRGETSAAVLDCMNYGLPTIVNANGSLANLSDDSIWKLPDEFSNNQLANALETLYHNVDKRQSFGDNARYEILKMHSPTTCAYQYFLTIEKIHQNTATDIDALTCAIGRIEQPPVDEGALQQLAYSVAQSIPPRMSQKQLLVDVSVLVQLDSKSGIQRVVRSILNEWLSYRQNGLRIEPVYATADRSYRYARNFTLGFLNCPTNLLSDEPIDYQAGDIFLGLDLSPTLVVTHQNYFRSMRRHGVQVKFVVYDLLCVRLPQHFIKNAAENFKCWLDVVTDSDGAICISNAVADEINDWVDTHRKKRHRPFNISWFHLGADIENSIPSIGCPDDADSVLNSINSRHSFLMVGTIEPRKSHDQVLAAFERLWLKQKDVNLVIVGKQGWLSDELIKKIQQHYELNNHLFWLKSISDEYLEKVYAASTCLIAASEGEGFGLPLIEAAQHKLPIIARDIPVFREVAGEYAYYFSGKSAEKLENLILEWMVLFDSSRHPVSKDLKYFTWKQSAKKLLDILTS